MGTDQSLRDSLLYTVVMSVSFQSVSDVETHSCTGIVISESVSN